MYYQELNFFVSQKCPCFVVFVPSLQICSSDVVCGHRPMFFQKEKSESIRKVGKRLHSP